MSGERLIEFQEQAAVAYGNVLRALEAMSKAARAQGIASSSQAVENSLRDLGSACVQITLAATNARIDARKTTPS